MDWVNITYLIAGALVAFGGSYGIECIKRRWEEKDRREKAKKLLIALEKEIEEGIKRSEGLIGFLKNNKLSFSRIYTKYWSSTNYMLIQYINNVEVLSLLHRIYYRFDLINFNMERDRFGVGAAFAKEYIDEIKDNFEGLRSKIS